jgi:hypothetical protein
MAASARKARRATARATQPSAADRRRLPLCLPLAPTRLLMLSLTACNYLILTVGVARLEHASQCLSIIARVLSVPSPREMREGARATFRRRPAASRDEQVRG